MAELQEIRLCLEQRVSELERCLMEKDDLIENLTSKLDQYQSVVHIASTAAAGGPRTQRAHGISAEPHLSQLSLQDLPKDIFITYPKSRRSVMYAAIRTRDAKLLLLLHRKHDMYLKNILELL